MALRRLGVGKMVRNWIALVMTLSLIGCAIEPSGNVDPFANDPTPEQPINETRRFLSKIYIDYPTDLRPALRAIGWDDAYGCVQRVEVKRGSDTFETVEFSRGRCPMPAGSVPKIEDVTARLVIKETGKEDTQFNPIYALYQNGKEVGQLVDYLNLSDDLLSLTGLCQVGTPRFSCAVSGRTDMAGRTSDLNVYN